MKCKLFPEQILSQLQPIELNGKNFNLQKKHEIFLKAHYFTLSMLYLNIKVTKTFNVKSTSFNSNVCSAQQSTLVLQKMMMSKNQFNEV